MTGFCKRCGRKIINPDKWVYRPEISRVAREKAYERYNRRYCAKCWKN